MLLVINEFWKQKERINSQENMFMKFWNPHHLTHAQKDIHTHTYKCAHTHTHTHIHKINFKIKTSYVRSMKRYRKARAMSSYSDTGNLWLIRLNRISCADCRPMFPVDCSGCIRPQDHGKQSGRPTWWWRWWVSVRTKMILTHLSRKLKGA